MKVASLSPLLLPLCCCPSTLPGPGRKSKIVRGGKKAGRRQLRWSCFTPLSRCVAHALAHGGAAFACP